jgi:SAM-dependent methyltransferase
VEFEDLRRTWDRFGETDPLWAVLTIPGKRGGGWDLEEFFATGRVEIDRWVGWAESLGLPARRDDALDFGCGVGRLSQPLAEKFEHVVGVDVAASMIALAGEHNPYPGRLEFVLNEADDLSRFGDESFDLIYTRIVLQHMDPRFSKRYMAEFCRLLRPGGVALFQVPHGPRPATAMPADAYRAAYEMLELRPVEGADAAEAVVRVMNAGGSRWPAEAALFLANHWHSTAGEMLIPEDARAPMPGDVDPGQSVDLTLRVQLPPAAGDYVLEFDIVHDEVCWFKQRGSPTLKGPVTVDSDSDAEGADGSEGGEPGKIDAPVMEVFGVPREQVEQIVREAGCKVADVADDPATGRSWISYMYAVTK